jgi:putative phage-type endonuclease
MLPIIEEIDGAIPLEDIDLNNLPDGWEMKAPPLGTIGASEVASILGVSPYRTPHQTWARLVGLVLDEKPNASLQMGNILEPAIREWYATRIGQTITAGPRYEDTPWLDPHAPWRHARPDGWWVGDACTHLLEIKTCRTWDGWGEEGTDQIPHGYLVQCLWQLSIAQNYLSSTVSDSTLVAYNKLSDEIRVYHIPRNIQVETILLTRVEKWYNTFVREHTPPPADGSDGCTAMLAALYPQHSPVWLEPTPETTAIVAQLRVVRDNIRRLEEEKKTFENVLKASIGPHAGIRGLVRWTGKTRRFILLGVKDE